MKGKIMEQELESRVTALEIEGLGKALSGGQLSAFVGLALILPLAIAIFGRTLLP